MCTIRTFLLRLLVDLQEPHALRGAIRPISSDNEYAFRDGEGLLALLRRMCLEEPDETSTASAADENSHAPGEIPE